MTHLPSHSGLYKRVATSLFEDLASCSDEAAAATCATSTCTYNNACYVHTYVRATH